MKRPQFTRQEMLEIADLMASAADRFTDTLENPLERPHYSAEDLTEMERKRSRARLWQAAFEINAAAS
jgi:hypothetical protein